MKRSLLVSEYIASVPVRDGCSQSARTVYIRLILSIAPIIITKHNITISGDHDDSSEVSYIFQPLGFDFAVDLSRFGSLYTYMVSSPLINGPECCMSQQNTNRVEYGLKVWNGLKQYADKVDRC
jgi:hypothetical protein